MDLYWKVPYKGERRVPAGAVWSSAALAWATASVTNQEHQETEMGYVFQFVWWHQTHPMIFVAHPEQKSPHMSGRFRLYILIILTHDALVCRVASTTEKTWLQTTRDQHMHPSAYIYVCASMWMHLNACESMCLWLSEGGNVFSSWTVEGKCRKNERHVLWSTVFVCWYSLWAFLIVEGVGDAQVHWEWAKNAALGLTLCSTQKQHH